MAHPTTARRSYYSSLVDNAFPLVRLHTVTLIGDKKVCSCWEGATCTKPGKHPISILPKSIITDLDEIETHLDAGGGIGLLLHPGKCKSLPRMPAPVVVFDVDDDHGMAWLAARGIHSPMVSIGSVGGHIYAVMAPGVPELKSDTRNLRDPLPKIDIKTSGFIVLPWSHNKTLHLHGADVSSDKAAVETFMKDWIAQLPAVDPRTVSPKMTVRNVPITKDHTSVSNACLNTSGTAASGVVQASNPIEPWVRLSDARPANFFKEYKDIPYNERKRRARMHAQNLLPSVQDRDPWKALATVVRDSIHHYGMSDQDTWLIVKRDFNPRCVNAHGRRYPWKRADAVKAIENAHLLRTYSMLSEKWQNRPRGKGKARTVAETCAYLLEKGKKANARKKDRKDAARTIVSRNLKAFLDHGYILDPGTRVRRSEAPEWSNRGVRFDDLHAEFSTWLHEQYQEPVTQNLVGRLLREMGFETARGWVKGLVSKGAVLRAAG